MKSHCITSLMLFGCGVAAHAAFLNVDSTKGFASEFLAVSSTNPLTGGPDTTVYLVPAIQLPAIQHFEFAPSTDHQIFLGETVDGHLAISIAGGFEARAHDSTFQDLFGYDEGVLIGLLRNADQKGIAGFCDGSVMPATLVGFCDGSVFEFSTGEKIGSVSITNAPVPEPASLSALGLGALVLIKRRRR